MLVQEPAQPRDDAPPLRLDAKELVNTCENSVAKALWLSLSSGAQSRLFGAREEI